ncbi:hypothetical protein Tco_0270155 [Tanacetum coccineum]
MVLTINIIHLKEIVDQACVKHSNDRLHLRNPTAQDMEILVKTCLMPLALKTQNDSLDEFVNKPVVKNCKAMSSEEEPKVVRKYNDALSIEEWVSDDEEEDVSLPKTEKKIVSPSIVKKEFVKSKQQEKTTRKIVKQGNPQMDLKDQEVIDSGCSRHMKGILSYQSQVLLRVPRKNNMYSLAHLYFKTMNKLVKGNLVRGLPSKLFENDQTCIACQKGKQHRASYEITELPIALYLYKVRECDCLAQKHSEQTEFVSKEICTELLWSFAKLEKHLISLEIALQECQEQLKNVTVCKEKDQASDYDNPDPAPELQNVSPSADTTVPSQQELDLLFGPLYDEFFNDGTSRVNKSSSPTDNSIQKDTLPSTHIQPTSEPTTPTNVHAEENNDNQAEFTNPFCTPVQENAESSSRNIGNSNVHTFNQPQDSEY